MTEALTGTPRGATRCGGCGHMRLRHLLTGTGPCADVHWDWGTFKGGDPRLLPLPCPCPMFTEPKGS